MLVDHLSKSKRALPVILLLYISSFIFMLIVVLVSSVKNIPLSNLTCNPNLVMGVHPLYGIVSKIGVLFWFGSAVICFFSYGLLRRAGENRDMMRLIILGGLITLILLLDDLFSIHERVYPHSFHEEITFLFYGMVFLSYLIKFKKLILGTNFFLLLFAFLFFGISMVVDQFPQSLSPWYYILEDGPKFFGIISWFGYYLAVCFQEVESSIHCKSQPFLRQSSPPVL
jgi:UDP-N-acetylmuramyl pentapeptide phosphotransferase/UDP-N-acetylglucosamine-1-phosphate transferase